MQCIKYLNRILNIFYTIEDITKNYFAILFDNLCMNIQ